MKIEKDYPIIAPGKGGKPKSPFRLEIAKAFSSMEIGDSFYLRGDSAEYHRKEGTIRKQAKESGIKVSFRKHFTDEGYVIGFRVWRVE